jgi:hypothetical protein
MADADSREGEIAAVAHRCGVHRLVDKLPFDLPDESRSESDRSEASTRAGDHASYRARVKKFVLDNPHPFIVALARRTRQRKVSRSDLLNSRCKRSREGRVQRSSRRISRRTTGRSVRATIGSLILQEPLRTQGTENRFGLDRAVPEAALR